MSKISKSSKEKSDVTGITPPKDGLTINQIYDELKVLEEHVKDLESIVLQQKRQGETTIDKKIKELEILKKALTDYVVKLEEIRPTIELLCSSPFSELKTKLQLLRAYRANLEKPEVQEFLKLIGQYATSPEKLEQLGAAIHLVGEAVDYAGITDPETMKRMLQLLCAIAKYPPKEMEEQIKKVNELYQTMSEYDAKVTEMTKVLNAQTIMINDLTKVLNKSLTVSSNMEQDLEKIVQTYVKYDGLPQGVPKEVEYRFPDCVVRVAESGEMQFDNDMYGAGNQIYRDPRGVWRLSNSNLDLGQELQPLFNAVHKHWTETYKPPIEISEEAPQNEGEQKGTEAAQSVVSPKQEEPFEIIKHAFLTWLCIKPQIKVYVKQGKKTVTYILPIHQEAQENQETQENQKTQKIDYSSVPPEHQQKVENYVNTHISEKQLEEYLKKFS